MHTGCMGMQERLGLPAGAVLGTGGLCVLPCSRPGVLEGSSKCQPNSCQMQNVLALRRLRAFPLEGEALFWLGQLLSDWQNLAA